VPLITIQPCSHPPELQFDPSEETQTVTAAPRLMASLRAKLALAIKSLAEARS